MNTYIYALCDPRTKEVKYIGKSNNPELRLAAHIADKTTNAGKAKWIDELQKIGMQPEMTILETVSRKNWQQAEIKWIAKGKQNGWHLLNIAPGGIGGIHLSSGELAEISLRHYITELFGEKIANRFDLWDEQQRRGILRLFALFLIKDIYLVDKAYKYFGIEKPAIDLSFDDIIDRLLRGDNKLSCDIETASNEMYAIVEGYGSYVHGWD